MSLETAAVTIRGLPGRAVARTGLRMMPPFPQSPLSLPGRAMARTRLVGIEIERDDRKVKGYHSRPFGCEVGAQFHHYPVSRSPPIMPDGRETRSEEHTSELQSRGQLVCR